MKIRFVRKKKSIFMLVFISLVIFYGLSAFYDDVLYFFHSSTPVKLGDAALVDASKLKTIKGDSFVQITGVRSFHAGEVKKGFWNDKYIIYYFLGSPNFLIFEKKSEKKDEKFGAVEVNIKGRIVPVKGNKSAVGLKKFFENSFAVEMSEESFIIYEGDAPGKNFLSLISFILLALIFVTNIFLFIKNRRIEDETVIKNGGENES